MSPLVIDIIVLAILALFAWMGAKKGLILTIFSLLALFVAFFGARYVTDHFHEPVADIIRPSIQLAVDDMLSGMIPDSGTIDPDSIDPDLLPEGVDPDMIPEDMEIEVEYDPTGHITLQQILTFLDSMDEFPELRRLLRDAIEGEKIMVTTNAVDAVVAYAAILAAKIILFALSFLLILLIWGLASRALDLTFKLPILSWINGVGGAIFGAIKGVAILLVVVWLGKTVGLLTPANMGPIVSMLTVEQLSELLYSVIAGTFVL